MQSAIQYGYGSAYDIKLDMSQLEMVAFDADLLMSGVELLMVGGRFRNETRTRIRDVINSVKLSYNGTPNATARRDRARLALFLAIASPEFVIQK
jgi:hypothetical protein